MAEIILPPEEEQEETPQAPELNIEKPTENSKVITIEFEAKKTNKVSTKDTNQQLYTTDTDAWFEFKETSLKGANATYSVVFRNRDDGSIFQRTGDVVNGVAYYKIPHQEIRHAGAWRGQVVYTLSNGDTTSREFGYDVKGHILDGKDVREIVVEDFETLMSQLRSMKDSAEVELVDLVNTANQNEADRQIFFDDLVEDIDDLQANYQELLDAGVLQTNVNEKLEALEEEYAPKLTEVTAQLAQTTFDYLSLDKNLQGSSNDILQPLTALVDRVKNENKGLYIPNGEFYLSDDFEISGIQNIIIDGTIEVAEGKTLEVSYSSATPVSCNWSFNYIKGKLRLSGMKNTIARITRTDELELYANGSIPSKTSIAYNQFHLGLIEKLTIFSEGESSSGLGGWINENIFIGGRLWDLTIDGNYSHNNNIFYKLSLESSRVKINIGNSNHFHDVRFEGVNEIFFGEGTFNNIIRKTWVGIRDHLYAQDLPNVTIEDLSGSNNVFLDSHLYNKKLVTINKFNNKGFDVINDLVQLSLYTPFFESGLINLPNFTFGLNFESSQPGLRPAIKFYDEDKNLITGNDPGFLTSPSLKWNVSSNHYSITSNGVSNTRATIDSKHAKYFEVILQYGVNVEIESFELNLIKFANKNTNLLEDGFNFYNQENVVEE